MGEGFWFPVALASALSLYSLTRYQYYRIVAAMPPAIVPQGGTVAASQSAVYMFPVWLYCLVALLIIGLAVAVYFAVKVLMRRSKVKLFLSRQIPECEIDTIVPGRF